MSGTLSKRQQVRNERALQDLVKSVPGNSVCADCQARNPGWASWSLGIFLCMRCAALHRKMGTHITKVKSLSMDSWSNDQVENMKRVGNVVSNRIYNPSNAKPPVPFDADEADSAMERFIRGKYQERAAARHDTGRSSNSDDHPPPLPPKTGSKFGFRSASSIFPLSSKSRRDPPPPVDILPRRRSPSPEYRSSERQAPAKVGSGPLDLAGKMAKLRDMGFADPKRNLAVLNGLGGNVEKTIDTLVRLGEGNGNKAGDSSSSRGSRTPITPAFPSGSGLAVSRARPTPSPKSTNPFDLLDIPPPAQPQSSQSTGSKPNPPIQPAANNPFLSPSMNTNPFGLTPSQSQYSLNQAFQNMAVSNAQPVQPLFPNHTGGVPASQQAQYQHHTYQQSAAPSVPLVPTRYATTPMHGGSPGPREGDFPANLNPFMQPQFQPAPNVNTNFQSNPYTQPQIYHSPVENSPAQQQFPSSAFPQGYPQQTPNATSGYIQQGGPQNPQQQMPNSPFDQVNQQQAQQNQQQFSSSLFDQNPQQQAQQQQAQQQQAQQQQSQQQFSSSPFDQVAPQQAQQPPQQHYNPFFAQSNAQQQAPQQAYMYQNQNQQAHLQQQMNQPVYQMQPQQAVKADTRSILDLFNQPQQSQAPSWPQAEAQRAEARQQTQNYPVPPQQQQQQQVNTVNQVDSQMAGNRNPFQTAPAGGYGQSQGGNPMLGNMAHLAPVQQNGSRHVSQESMSIDVGGWQNGRHSPDAWGTISARSVR